MREDRQLENIINLIKAYGGKEPLNRYLKSHFQMHPEMGSRDRRQASDFIYNYYRIGRAIPGRSMEERIAAGNYLCAQTDSPLLQYCISKFLNGITGASQQDKINSIHSLFPEFRTEDIFPFSNHLTEQIDKALFILSFLRQPRVWIRVRRKFLNEVSNELTKENISYDIDDENPLTFSFSHSAKLDKLKSYEKGYFEIQDGASQQTVKYFRPRPNESWWDACAGSGGKSLLLYDVEPSIHLTVSDSRESILNNLKERFRKVELRSYHTIQMDLTNRKQETGTSKLYNGILADVPCTGSGTWARTPEWLTLFDEASINRFALLQKEIVANIIPYLKKEGVLIYITCSVFKEENEEVVTWMQNEFGLLLEESTYIKGYDRGGDTMFVARLVSKKG